MKTSNFEKFIACIFQKAESATFSMHLH